MPELPEVETVCRQLARKIVGKKLGKHAVAGVRRRAKIIIIDFKDGSSLLFHLKLTGQLIFNGTPSAYTRKVFYFNDGTRLVFNDVRKLGWWKKIKDTKPIEKGFGPESLEIDLKTFRDILRNHPNAKIKSALMNQKIIAGIGNIYSDEILFAAKVGPLRLIKTLTDKEIQQIHQYIKKILKRAIQYRGTTEKDYRDVYGRKGGYLKYIKVYNKEGESCSRCGGLIKRIKLGGRSAHFCPVCQKM